MFALECRHPFWARSAGAAYANINVTVQMEPEFDQFAGDYERMLHDPIRDRFARDSLFFHRRKWELLEYFFRAR